MKKNKSFIFMFFVALALTGCLRPDVNATAPPAPPLPLHCLSYTDLEDEVFPDTAYVFANCAEQLPGGAAVSLAPIAPFNADDAATIGALHYVAALNGQLMQVGNPLHSQMPAVGYEYADPQNKHITKQQLVSIEQNLQRIVLAEPIAPVIPAPPALPANPAQASPTTPKAGEPAANIDLEKLADNLIQAVQWYETIRPLLTNITTQSASEADNAVIQILDLTLKPLAATVKEVNGIVSSVQSAATAEQKAQYTTDAALRIQQSTAALQTYIWTLVYKKIEK